jgi:hypothetical protein
MKIKYLSLSVNYYKINTQGNGWATVITATAIARNYWEEPELGFASSFHNSANCANCYIPLGWHWMVILDFRCRLCLFSISKVRFGLPTVVSLEVKILVLGVSRPL